MRCFADHRLHQSAAALAAPLSPVAVAVLARGLVAPVLKGFAPRLAALVFTSLALGLAVPASARAGTPGLGPVAAAPAAHCSDLDPANLRRLTQDHPETQLVFFATWCSACVVHLKEKHAPGTLLIASFSEQADADAVIRKLNPDVPCYFDRGLSAAYHVQGVPAVVAVDRDGRELSVRQ